ncbi:MAG: winged helix DNA-binding domain-containing protein [Actinomycetota bacterium]|nr:winged helix DNA-binding domain-containing protein [Actinomycetota bacterium]
MTAETLTGRQLNRATLARQLLLEREPIGPLEAISRLCGLQAQEPAPPFIGLWTRLAGFEREHLLAALRDREVVRATLMRATLHLLGAEDYAAFRPVLQPVMERAVRVLGERAKGLEPARVLPAARALLLERPLGFNELRRLLQEQFPDVNDRALGYTVRTHVPLVMVPTDARWGFPSVGEFTLADTWLGGALPEDGAPEQLVRRYLAAFGPASAADAQTWSGLQGLAAVFEAMRPELLVFKGESGRRELFDLSEAPRPDADVPVPARFLPEFDNLVLAHADRTRLLADEHRAALVTKNLRVRAAFLWDGMVAGTWEIQRKRAAATLVMTPFHTLPARAAKALSAEAESLLRFAADDATSFAVRIA